MAEPEFTVFGVQSGESITPNDSTLLETTRGVYIGGEGTLAVLFENDSVSVTLIGLAVGVWHPMRVKKILATGTTATEIRVGR